MVQQKKRGLCEDGLDAGVVLLPFWVISCHAAQEGATVSSHHRLLALFTLCPSVGYIYSSQESIFSTAS